MDSTGCYETRHGGGNALDTHRHTRPYAALVVDGSHVEASVDGPILCEPGTLLLHPAFHAHGNTFGRQGARVLNLPLEHDLELHGAVACKVPSLSEARQVLRLAGPRAVRALFEVSEPLQSAAPDWQAAFLSALRDSDEPAGAIAARLGVSAGHASRAFRRSHGMGPRALRLELRWRRALGLLTGPGSLADIAAQAGFADQSHFNRVVRGCSGQTPARLRAQIKCVQDTSRARMAQSA
jgi:AraC family transcriptional regulator